MLTLAPDNVRHALWDGGYRVAPTYRASLLDALAEVMTWPVSG